MAQSGERVSITFHRACGMNVARSGSVAPIQPLGVVQGQHIAVSTNRTVNICSVVPVESAEWPILIFAQAQYIPLMYYPTCKRTSLGSIGHQFGNVQVWQISVSYDRNLGSFKVRSVGNPPLPMPCILWGTQERVPLDLNHMSSRSTSPEHWT